MKAAICLVSLAILAGVVHAANRQFAWDPDTLYTYRVQSRFAAGMLGLDGPTVDDTETDRAFVELKWELDVYEAQQNQIYLRPRGFQVVTAKQQIHPREEQITAGTEVNIPEKYEKLLKKTMLVKLDPQSGVPDSIVVRSDEPLSTLEKNIKRAQVQAFILNPGTSNLVVKGNINRQTNSVSQSEQDDDSGFFYKVLEESIHGECQTYYHVSQTGPFQSLYQMEAQDVPAQDDENEIQDEEQSPRQHPRFQQQSGYNNNRNRQQQQQQHWQQARQNQNEQNQGYQNSQQQPWPQAFAEFCENNDQVYVIQKTVNLTACTERPVLATMMPAELQDCRPGDNSCGSLWNHVVNTRFVACGSNREDFTIIEVNQEERFVYGLRTDQNIDGFAVKNVTILQKQRTSSSAAAEEFKQDGKQEYVINSLVYEFDLSAQQKQMGGQRTQQQQHWQEMQQKQQSPHLQRDSHHQPQQDSESDSDEESDVPQGTNGPITFPLREHQPSLENPPLRPRLVTTVASPEQLQERAQKLLQEAAHNIHDHRKSIAEGETISLQSVLAKSIRYMSKKQILQLYQEAIQQYNHDPELQATVQNLLMDAIVAAGTNPALVATMELIEEEEITDAKAAQLIMTFAHYARHPTKEFLERFQRHIKSTPVQNNNDMRTTALLSYSTLLHQACLNARTKQSSYSYSLYGPFCQPEDAEQAVDQAIKALQNALQKSRKQLKHEGINKAHEISLQLAVLGNIGHPKMVKVIQQILDDSNDVQEKSKAIYALKHLVRSHEENFPAQHKNGNVNTDQNQNEVDRVEDDPINDDVVEKKVLPLLVSVALDKTEHPTVRCAAIQMLVYCTYADMTVYQQLAMSTWFETSQEVHNFIVTTITSLADLEVAPTRQHKRIIVKARSVQPLLRPLEEDNASRSANSFASGNVQHLNSQFFRQLSWIGSRDSVIPTSIYYRSFISFGSGAVGVNPIEAAVHFRTLQQAIDQVYDTYGSSSSEESGEKNQNMKKILDNIVTRQMKEDPHGSVYLNLRNGMQRLWQVDNLAKYLSWKSISNFVSLRRGIPFNYQKTIQLAHQTYEMPTILGLPMSFKLRLPAMVSLRGSAKVNAGRKETQFHAQIDAVAGYKRHAKISLKIPYIQRKIESGMQTHFVAQVPLRFTVRQRDNEPTVVAITPTNNINSTQPTGQIELITFHRQPYVAVIEDELYPTVHNKGGQMTVIRTNDQPITNENHMEDVLGFSVVTKEVSDYREEKETPEGWSTYYSNFADAETYANLGSFGGPVAKYASRKVILNVDESNSKTLVLLVAAKRGQGTLEEGFDTDLSSSSSSSSSSSESNADDTNESSNENNGQQQDNQESSSSSSSEESNEASNSNEDSAEVFRKGRLIVVAVLAKRKEVPVVGRVNGLINLLKAEYPNQKQYILQLSKRTNKFFLRYAQGAAAEEAARSLPSESSSVEKLAKAVIDPDYQGQQQEFCSEISAKVQYPKHAHPRLLIALREALLNKELSVDVNALAQFAHTCKDQDLSQNEIRMTGQLQRSSNMTEWATSKSSEAQQCQDDENQGFSVSDDCLTVAVEQASALDTAHLNFQWTDSLPQEIQQAVYDARDTVKALYYPHVSHNRFPSQPANGNSAIVELQISPDAEYWSASVLTNETELQINNVPSNDYVQAALPPSAIQSISQNIQDSTWGTASQPSCQVEGNTISSFDNVVGDFDQNVAQNCYHLLVADGSGSDSMAILAKNLGTDNIKLQLILSQTKIQLSGQRSVPRPRLAQLEAANDIAAVVNGQAVTLPFTVRKQGQRPESNDYVARIQPHPSGGVQILTPKNDIAFDGSKLIIFVDDSYRNQTVGMCGDFDGEKVADRRSRKDIPLSNVTLLYANYAYDPEGSNQCNVNQEIQQQIKEEESLAKINRDSGNGAQNLRFGPNAPNSRSQQRSTWQNKQWSSRSNNYQSDSSSSEEQNPRQQQHQQRNSWQQQQHQQQNAPRSGQRYARH